MPGRWPVLNADDPEAAERLRELFATDPHFVQLSEQYEEVNRQIEAGLTGDDPASAALDAVLRRKRQMLESELHARLKPALSDVGDDERRDTPGSHT
jgi:uncharacterized protein YdcH (DUF465 family)